MWFGNLCGGMGMKRILLLLFLALNCNAIIYLQYQDDTGDFKQTAYLYQNDQISHRFIKVMNFSEQNMETICNGINYTIVLLPDDEYRLSDIESGYTLDYIMYKFWWLILLVAVFFLLFSVIVVIYKRGKHNG